MQKLCFLSTTSDFFGQIARRRHLVQATQNIQKEQSKIKLDTNQASTRHKTSKRHKMAQNVQKAQSRIKLDTNQASTRHKTSKRHKVGLNMAQIVQKVQSRTKLDTNQASN